MIDENEYQETDEVQLAEIELQKQRLKTVRLALWVGIAAIVGVVTVVSVNNYLRHADRWVQMGIENSQKVIE